MSCCGASTDKREGAFKEKDRNKILKDSDHPSVEMLQNASSKIRAKGWIMSVMYTLDVPTGQHHIENLEVDCLQSCQKTDTNVRAAHHQRVMPLQNANG